MQRSGGAVERRPDVVARRVVAAATGASRKGNPNRDRSWPSGSSELGRSVVSRKTRPLRCPLSPPYLGHSERWRDC